MISFIKKYRAFGLAAIIVAAITLYLEHLDFIRIPKDEPLETVVIFGFWWIVTGFALYNLKYLKNKKTVLIKIGFLSFIAFLTFGTDNYFNIPNNPIVIFLIVVFWLGLLYLVFPKFFKKYSVLIVLVYGLILCYFFYLRLDENYTALYHHRVLNLLMFPIPIIFFIWLYEQWKWFKTLKSEKTKAELDLLKTQVNPHFLFNSLNNLYSLTVNQSPEAPDVVLKLSDMLRYTIYEGKNDRVLLSEEIQYLKNYIALHEIRHKKNVTIQFTHNIVPDDKVAPLLFIILLENAFKHGIEKLTNDAYAIIKLNSDKNQIYFSIENNYEAPAESNHKGIGIENLKRRLLLIYPDAHQLIINQMPSVYKVELTIRK
ncbi:sensor histidine kinase [uncultured Psychroserpens sp.]|uniref:sensor histidine kinase n=1 Tax=uncultured Psychroserpens sp. TaxID=255436 RepID=UPI00262DCBBE|nr:sensor histidine kinase [uncultured Psychroserpens sp.]